MPHLRVAILVALFVGGGRTVPVPLQSSDEPPTTTVGNVAELLHIDVEHRARMVVFVATDGFAGSAVDVGEPVEMGIREDAVDRRRRDPEPIRELHRSFAET